jgi:hypothetical protein
MPLSLHRLIAPIDEGDTLPETIAGQFFLPPFILHAQYTRCDNVI